jgi:AAA15 family ATPase/GTPase
MLLEFRVTNFRSINECQVFSMVAGTATQKSSKYSIATENNFAPFVLNASCLVGSNGAGKSSLVNAIDFFTDFVRDSSARMTEGDVIEVKPFKLDDAAGLKSEFEIRFVVNGTYYQFGFLADSERIYEEWLYTRNREPGSRNRTVFQRIYLEDESNYVWDMKDSLKGEKEQWKKATRKNALFLSTAVQLNSEQLKEPYEWIGRHLRVIHTPTEISTSFTAKSCKVPEYKHKIMDLIRSADLNIEDILVEEKEMDIPKPFLDIVNDDTLKKLKARSHQVLELTTVHSKSDGSPVQFDLAEESGGTQAIIALAGPLVDVLENGYTLVADELQNSLHPHALLHLVRMFSNPALNKKGAQLIFTTHDKNILSELHRDQIWVVSKNDRKSSDIYPLSDFNVRGEEAFGKSYLAGKFGGLPRLKDLVIGE